MHTHTYTAITFSSPLSSLAAVPIDTDGDKRMRYNERQRHTEGVDSLSLYQLCSSLPLSIHFSPSITCTCSIRLSFRHPAIHPSFTIYQPQPPSIHQGSIWTLSTVLELQPAAIHPLLSIHPFVSLSLKPDPGLYHDLLSTY